MSYKRTHLDANHTEIVREAKKIYSVMDNAPRGDGEPDLVVCSKRVTAAIELKPEKGGVFYLLQLQKLAEWKNYSGFARNFDELHRLMQEPEKYALTDGQKDRLLTFVEREKVEQVRANPRVKLNRVRVSVKRVEEILNG